MTAAECWGKQYMYKKDCLTCLSANACGEEWSDRRRVIRRHAIEALPHAGEPYPPSWDNAVKVLEGSR